MKLNLQEPKNIKDLFLALGITTFTVLVVIYSEAAFNAAYQGLLIWWQIVVPALLAFFILAEILMGLGVVRFLGVLLEPLMQPLFRIPGVGAFAFAMGLASGYPIGAKIAGDLRKDKLCSKEEGERLLCLANTADPLFMIGAVSIGMFKLPELSFIICACHYISVLAVGLIFRFHGSSEHKKSTENKYSVARLVPYAVSQLIQARQEDNRPFGQILGDAIRDSVNILLLIGGFIVLFSVVTEIIQQIKLSNILESMYFLFLYPLGIPESLFLPILSGIFEITNGTALTSAEEGPVFIKVVITNALIAWSGLSVHAQVSTMIQGTDLSIKPYILARLVHALLAGALTYLWWQPISILTSTVWLPPFMSISFWSKTTISAVIFLLLTSLLIFLSLFILSLKRI